ncbi:MAG: PorT family protein [Treponema sp.]|nr:PorT family protein [Treponema sp.]
MLCACILLWAPAYADAQSEASSSLKLVEHPWYFGIYGGYAHNTLYQGGAEDSRPGKAWESGHGWTIGIPVRFQIFNWLAVQVEPTFITKNYRYSSPIFGGDYFNQTTNSFFDIPVLVNLSIPLAGISGLRLFVNGGVFLGVWAASHEYGRSIPIAQTPSDPIGLYYEYDEDYTFDERRDSRFDGGFVAGAGVQYEFRWFNVFAEWRYNYSLSDLQKPYQKQDFSPLMNDTWTVQLGIMINPGKIKGKR